jgi:hypothetical protein
MIRLLSLALASVSLVAACGETKPALSEAHVRMAKLCVDIGGEKAVCDCQAAKVDELVASNQVDAAIQKSLILQAEADALSLEMAKATNPKVAEAARIKLAEKESELEDAFTTLSYDERFRQSALVGEKQLECDTAAPT